MFDPLSALRAVSGTDAAAGATTLPNIPAVPYTEDGSLTNILSAMKLWMEKAGGQGLTGFASKQDLIDAGVLEKDASGKLTPAADISLAIPPVPTGLAASGAMTNIIVVWDNPSGAYGNHGYTEVWAAETDNFTNAVLVGQGSGFVFSHALGEDSTRYYWIRFVSTSGVKGPFNSVSGTMGQTAKNPAYLMDVLTEEYGTGSVSPFFQLDAPVTINGVEVPAGTYMKTAFIHDAAITNAKIKDLAVDTAKIADAAIQTAKIDDAAITSAKIGTAAINSAHIGFAEIKTANIDNAAITTAKIGDAAITTAKIDNAAITTAKIGDASITTAKIGDAQVDTLKIKGDAVIVPSFVTGSNSASTAAFEMVNSQRNALILSHEPLSASPMSALHLYRNGVRIGTYFTSNVPITVVSGETYYSSYSPVRAIYLLVDVIPNAGNWYYTVAADTADGSKVSLLLLGVKR